ncbi:proline racemase family protein [Peribacillus simplex]|uniref:proline racemase family protein n=1 Tax=Peribacillus simplex TaxID=1478 RepID=UPI00366CB64E
MEFEKVFNTIDVHTAGEPLRIILNGIQTNGYSMKEMMDYVQKNFDLMRKILMSEPRGHQGMSGAIITPPFSPKTHFGVIFMNNTGYDQTNGTGIISSVTAMIETGQIKITNSEQEVRVDTVEGVVSAYVDIQGSEVKSVTLKSKPSFVIENNVPITALDTCIHVDIIKSGKIFALVNVKDLDNKLDLHNLIDFKKLGTLLKKEIDSEFLNRISLEYKEPTVYGVIFCDNPINSTSHSRNLTVFADQQIDRSPGVFSTFSKLTSMFFKNEITIGEEFVNESIIGTQFESEIIELIKVEEGKSAVISKIKGRAFITGIQQFVMDPTDPLEEGFLLK